MPQIVFRFPRLPSQDSLLPSLMRALYHQQKESNFESAPSVPKYMSLIKSFRFARHTHFSDSVVLVKIVQDDQVVACASALSRVRPVVRWLPEKSGTYASRYNHARATSSATKIPAIGSPPGARKR